MRTMRTGEIEAGHLAVPVGKHDHIQGPEDAPLTLLEYGDFECPFCGQAHPSVKAVQQTLGANLRFVFRHFPLTNVHAHAEHAAEAAEAAAAQGQFWEMHDLLYENQDALEDEDLAEYAAELGLDARRVINEIETGAHRPRIRQDFTGGVRSGVNGTPCFFINDIRHDGSYDPETLLAVLTGKAETSRT